MLEKMIFITYETFQLDYFQEMLISKYFGAEMSADILQERYDNSKSV